MSRGHWFAVVAIFCFIVPACQKADKRINKANFEKIKPEMTMAQVEELLGGPGEPNPDLDISEGSSAAGAVGVTTMDLSSSKSGITWYKWGTDRVYIAVAFKRDKTVAAVNEKVSKGLK